MASVVFVRQPDLIHLVASDLASMLAKIMLESDEIPVG